MRESLDSSYQLLLPAEQMLFRRLAVFEGGWGIEAAEQVCDGGGLEDYEILDSLGALVAKSVVVADTAGREARYRLLEPIRWYAEEKLAEAGELPRTASRHASWCLDLALEMTSGDANADHLTPEAAEALEKEYPNLTAGLTWALSERRTKLAVSLVSALVPFWHARGSYQEGRRWCDLALELDLSSVPELHVRILFDVGTFATLTGDWVGATAYFRESLGLGRRRQDPKMIAWSLSLLGFASSFGEGPRVALPLLEEGVAVARQEGEGVNLARMLAVVASIHRLRGDPVAARPVLEECLDLARAAGDAQTVAAALAGLGWVALAQSDYYTAEDLLGQALVLSDGWGQGNDHALTLNFLGELAAARGEVDEAREHFDIGLKVAQAAGAPLPSASCLENLGRLALAEGNLERAERCFVDALAVAERAGLWSLRARCLQGLGELSLIKGEPGLARHRFRRALSLARDVGDRRATADALSALAALTQARGDQKRAVSMHVEALSLRHEVGDRAGVARSLETFAHHARAHGQPDVAVRLLGAVNALRQDLGADRARGEGREATAAEAGLEAELGAEAFAAAWEEGAALTADEAVTYASRGRGPRPSAITGWESLTGAEREVAELVRQGLTNPEVAARLFMSPRTVQGHLKKIFAKLHISSRRQIREQAAVAEDPPKV